ncbi:MAG: TadE/TadG family type IV pilus assembly protein [Candidatus Zixiibacteriota bacterium]
MLDFKFIFRGKRRRLRSGRGQSVIEFAFILPLLLLLVFGIVEVGRMLMRANLLTQAAREGARAAAVGVDSLDVVDRVTGVLTAAGVGQSPETVEVVVAGPDGNQMMTVTVLNLYYVLSPGTVLPFPSSLTLRGVAAMRLEG